MDFSKFSPDSRIWVYPIKITLNKDRLGILEQKIQEFLGRWQAHGASVTAAYKVIDNRFIAISADANCTAATGCSVDSMRKFLSETLKALSTDISDFNNIYYLVNNEVIEISRPDFAQLVSQGRINKTDKVYDLAPADLATFLSKGICLKFEDSWHSKVFK